jgi:hypothetical protein
MLLNHQQQKYGVESEWFLISIAVLIKSLIDIRVFMRYSIGTFFAR